MSLAIVDQTTSPSKSYIHARLSVVNVLTMMAFVRRKECCHPFDAKDMFKFMTILIKISNHLALIMPGEFRGRHENSRTDVTSRV
jgi:hypothetical protein